MRKQCNLNKSRLKIFGREGETFQLDTVAHAHTHTHIYVCMCEYIYIYIYIKS